MLVGLCNKFLLDAPPACSASTSHSKYLHSAGSLKSRHFPTAFFHWIDSNHHSEMTVLGVRLSKNFSNQIFQYEIVLMINAYICCCIIIINDFEFSSQSTLVNEQQGFEVCFAPSSESFADVCWIGSFGVLMCELSTTY